MKVKVIKNLMKNTRWKTVFGQFRKIIILCFIIPVILIDVIVAIIYAGKINNEIENNLNVAYLKTSICLEEQFKQINDSFNSISQENVINTFMMSSIDKMSGMEATAMGDGISSLIINAVRTSDTVESIGIYSMKNRYVISSAQSGYVDEIHPEWYERYLTCKKSEFVYSSGDTVNVCHGINPGGELSGLMIFSLNKQELEHKIRLDDYRLDIGLILTNIDGNTVFECGNTGNGTKKDRIYDFSNESVSMTFAEGSGNARTVYETATIYFLLYLAVSVAVVFIMAFVCSILLYESISDILSRIDPAEDKNIKNLNSNVLELLNNGENIEEKIAQSLNALHSAQLSALQMQINPHFVFNVLNFANAVIMEITKCDNDAIRIIILLCNILQFAMDEPKYETTVGREIEISKEYIEIERLKTGLDFEAIWDVDKACEDCVCLKLFLQPIIENSVMHGFKEMTDKKGILKIAAKRDSDKLIFIVEDNGPGMSPDKLLHMREQLKVPFEDFARHIGMRNVNQRIKLVYGEECGMSVESDSNGTRVTMIMYVDKER